MRSSLVSTALVLAAGISQTTAGQFSDSCKKLEYLSSKILIAYCEVPNPVGAGYSHTVRQDLGKCLEKTPDCTLKKGGPKTEDGLSGCGCGLESDNPWFACNCDCGHGPPVHSRINLNTIVRNKDGDMECAF